MFSAFWEVARAVFALVRVLRLRRPGRVFIVIYEERKMGMLVFKLVLPVVAAMDVVKRHLQVQLGTGAEPQVFELDKNVTETEEFRAPQGTVVTGSLIDEDDAGNRSEPSTFEFTLEDTIAPPQPGQVGLVVTNEEPDEPPAPEPEPEPTPEV